MYFQSIGPPVKISVIKSVPQLTTQQVRYEVSKLVTEQKQQVSWSVSQSVSQPYIHSHLVIRVSQYTSHQIMGSLLIIYPASQYSACYRLKVCEPSLDSVSQSWFTQPMRLGVSQALSNYMLRPQLLHVITFCKTVSYAYWQVNKLITETHKGWLSVNNQSVFI